MPIISSVLLRYWKIVWSTCCCIDFCRCGWTSVINDAAKVAPAAALSPLSDWSCVCFCSNELICDESCLFCRTICDKALLEEDSEVEGTGPGLAVEDSRLSDANISSQTSIGSMMESSVVDAS